MGYHIVRDSEDHMEILTNKEYRHRLYRKGCLAILLVAIIIGWGAYYEDEKPAKNKTEVVSRKNKSVETKTEQPAKSHEVIEEENPTTTYENVEEKEEECVKENVEEDVSSGKEEKSISIDELVKRYQNNQDQ